MHVFSRFSSEATARAVTQAMQDRTNIKIEYEYAPTSENIGQWIVFTLDLDKHTFGGFGPTSLLDYGIQKALFNELAKRAPRSPLLDIWHLQNKGFFYNFKGTNGQLA